MCTKEITAIALRLFSVWLLVQVILNVPGIALVLTSVEQYRGQVVPGYVYFVLIGSFIAIGFLAAYLIWVSARSVLTRLPSASSQPLDTDGQQFLLQLGGAYFIITSLAYLPRSLGVLAQSLDFSYMDLLWPLGLVFQLGIGLALLVRAFQWAVLLAKLRGAHERS